MGQNYMAGKSMHWGCFSVTRLAIENIKCRLEGGSANQRK